MSRLIVKNIPNNISEFDIKKHFESVGDITDVKISFKGDKNRRFCFVGYKTE
jgi:RNA recognition motif-containing protein